MLDNISRYVFEVWRAKSVSEAAKRLYISQPALSSAIKKAEAELGTPIFNRSTIPFTLTPEGKVYINAIEEVMRIEEQTKNTILDISEMNSGSITVATATHTSFYAIPKICKVFSERFPKIDINVIFSDTDSLDKLLSSGAADLIFISEENESGAYKSETLFTERCIVAVGRDYKSAQKLSDRALNYTQIINRSYTKEDEISDISLFSGIDFIYNPPRSNMYKKRRLLLGDLGVSNHITTNSAKLQLNYNLMRAGFGALFTTDTAIATMPKTDDCLYFVLDNPEATRGFAVVYNSEKDGATGRIVTEFVNTAKSLFAVQNPLSLLTF